jgi:hypothetical protein
MVAGVPPAATAFDSRPGCLGLIWRFFRVLVGKRPADWGCIYLPGRITDRPDPCIYDQFLLMALGLPVTWANPDFEILLAGIPQDTYNLVEGTTYDLNITVHNSSRTRAALGTSVTVVWMEFGAGGTIKHPLGSAVVDVPVWPGVVKVPFKWTTPQAGHYCLQAQLNHPNDLNPANNLGQNNTQVYKAHSQIRDPIRVFNAFADEAAAGGGATSFVAPSKRGPNHGMDTEITVDSYVFVDKIGKEADPDVMFAPRKAVWNARVEPAAFTFAPGEKYRDVMLVVDAPDGPGPAEVFNVNVRQGGAPTGGVTVTVTRG